MPPSSPFSLRTTIYATIDPKSLEGSLTGKNALVTGSSRGIGRHIANALAQAGANIAITGRSEVGVQSAVQEVSKHGTQVIGVTADVLVHKDLEHLVQKVRPTSSASTHIDTYPHAATGYRLPRCYRYTSPKRRHQCVPAISPDEHRRLVANNGAQRAQPRRPNPARFA